MKVPINTTRYITIKLHGAPTETAVLASVLEKYIIAKANPKRSNDIIRVLQYYATNEPSVLCDALKSTRTYIKYELIVRLIQGEYLRKMDMLEIIFSVFPVDYIAVNGSALILFALQHESPEIAELLLERGAVLANKGVFVRNTSLCKRMHCNHNDRYRKCIGYVNVFYCASRKCLYIPYRCITQGCITSLSCVELEDLTTKYVPPEVIEALNCIGHGDCIIDLAMKVDNTQSMTVVNACMNDCQRMRVLNRMTRGMLGILLPKSQTT